MVKSGVGLKEQLDRDIIPPRFNFRVNRLYKFIVKTEYIYSRIALMNEVMVILIV